MSLRRIAQSLNISVTTASRALGGFSDVAPETRERVRAEAERLGYRPNAAARRLRGGTSDAVGVVLPTGPGQLEDAFFLRLLGAIGPKLAAAGLDLIVGTARAGEEEQAFYRQLVENRRVDAVILARTRRQDPRVGYLLDSRMPFVVHGRTEEARPHAHVDVDGEAAFRLAARRLIAAGHRRIGLLGRRATTASATTAPWATRARWPRQGCPRPVGRGRAHRGKRLPPAARNAAGRARAQRAALRHRPPRRRRPARGGPGRAAGGA
ncbi:LacI family DNA-binding transcriptional regulator [Pseudoroseomonas wenyumeiae]